MARRPNVPAFGNWEKEQGDVPYTVFFEKARQVKGGKIINPNENPDVFSKFGPPAPAPTRAPPPQSKPEPIRHLGESGSRHKQQGAREIGLGEPQRRHPRSSVGSENSFDKTPPRQQARNSGVSWDVRTAPDKPRNNSRGGNRDGNTGRGPAVPKFGAWDENNPASADGFTHIFQKVREEKNTGEVRTPVRPNTPPPSTGRQQNTTDKVKVSCLQWFRK